MVTDVLGLGMALAAIQLATRGSERRQHTYGLYRLEILAAFVNALLLFGVALYVLVEAVRRFGGDSEVLGRPMLVVAVLGLAANLAAFGLLRRGATESLNIEGAYLEVLADTLGSVGAIAAAVLLEVFGWTWVDPLVAVGIGLWILPRTWRLGRQAVRILLQAAPPGIDPVAVEADLSRISGVTGVHDLHIWTLTSDMESASAHVEMAPGADPDHVLTQARTLLRDAYGINHATVQVEAGGEDCGDCSW
jgi:cobalt-zinc-cadmium efflux system protein